MMIDIPHKLGAAEAKRRMEGKFGALADKIPGGKGAQIREDWDGDRMRFSAQAMGQEVSGTIDVLDSVVRMDVSLPPLLAAMAGMIKGPIEAAGQKLLENK